MQPKIAQLLNPAYYPLTAIPPPPSVGNSAFASPLSAGVAFLAFSRGKGIPMLMQLKRFGHLTLVAATLGAATACDDPLISEEEVAGAYEVTRLLVTEDGSTFDALEMETNLEIVLHEDGTTTGHFFFPSDEGEEDSGVDADLTGTWDLEDGRLTFDHEADTFLRDVVFEVEGDDLVSDHLFPDGTRIQTVLSRQ